MFTRTAGHIFQYQLLFTPAEEAFIKENLLLMAALYCLVYLKGVALCADKNYMYSLFCCPASK